MAHKEDHPVQANHLLLCLKSRRVWNCSWERVCRMHEVRNGRSPQTLLPGCSRPEANPRAPKGRGWPWPTLNKGPHPTPRAAPRHASLSLLHCFSQTGQSRCRPRGQRQGGAQPPGAHARAHGLGWSKQTLLKGHFCRLWLRWPEETAIIFQGCKCQKKNALSHSFPPCPWSAERLLARHFLAK